uniref:Uncharacterized protein n=1 Tax=uncultured Planctomycetota bacterium TaxID=120965 RepID=H5SC99_9BACT|nr:hypothetical protein HGMM_F08F10C04 [uncultured Planctomycetota bacterium]
MFNALRASFARDLRGAGLDINAYASIMGHTPVTAVGHYRCITECDIRKVQELRFDTRAEPTAAPGVRMNAIAPGPGEPLSEPHDPTAETEGEPTRAMPAGDRRTKKRTSSALKSALVASCVELPRAEPLRGNPSPSLALCNSLQHNADICDSKKWAQQDSNLRPTDSVCL